MKNMGGNPKDNRTSAVMFQRILTAVVALEDTVVVFAGSILEPPVGAPAIPHGHEDGCMNPRRHQFGNLPDSPSHKVTVHTWQAGNAIGSAIPSLHFVTNPLNSVRCPHPFNNLVGYSLEAFLNSGQLLSLLLVISTLKGAKQIIGQDLIGRAPSNIVHKHFAERVLIPLGPADQTVQVVSPFHSGLQRLPS